MKETSLAVIIGLGRIIGVNMAVTTPMVVRSIMQTWVHRVMSSMVYLVISSRVIGVEMEVTAPRVVMLDRAVRPTVTIIPPRGDNFFINNHEARVLTMYYLAKFQSKFIYVF